MLKDFVSDRIDLGDVQIAYRTGGEGQPLLLLHGFPENGNAWHRVAPEFARHFRVIVPDLRGAGDSSVPAAELGDRAMSNRVMARDMSRLLEHLGIERTAVLAQDVGAQVALRMGLDDPRRLTRLGVIEAVPNGAAWTAGPLEAMASVHRMLLAAPIAERLIGADPTAFVDSLLTCGTAEQSIFGFDARLLSSYRQQACDPLRIAAACRMFRAGATLDTARDLADSAAGRRLEVPVQVLSGGTSARRLTGNTWANWHRWARRVALIEGRSGFHVAEEDPSEVLDTFLPFLLGGSPGLSVAAE